MSQSENERFNQSPEAGAVAPCWSCKQPVAARALFCHSCGAVQAPGQLDHFARLGVAPDFDLDLDRLEKQYLGFQRAIIRALAVKGEAEHPDDRAWVS